MADDSIVIVFYFMIRTQGKSWVVVMETEEGGNGERREAYRGWRGMAKGGMQGSERGGKKG